MNFFDNKSFHRSGQFFPKKTPSGSRRAEIFCSIIINIITEGADAANALPDFRKSFRRLSLLHISTVRNEFQVVIQRRSADLIHSLFCGRLAENILLDGGIAVSCRHINMEPNLRAVGDIGIIHSYLVSAR